MEQKQGVTRLARDLEHLSIEERGKLRGVVVRQRPGPEELRKNFEQVVHACRCPLRGCEFENCNVIKEILCHDFLCKKRVDGGCCVCVMMWKLLKYHAQGCKETSNCNVPHCRELKLCFVTITPDDVLHSSRCQTPLCEYSNCSKAKELLCHGRMCKTGSDAGCPTCKKMWYILRLHAEACEEESNCSVMRCRDLKERLKMVKHYSDSRSGATVSESS